MVLRSCRDLERESETPGCLAGRAHALHGASEFVDPAVALVVLDRASHGAGLGSAGDHLGGVLGVGSVPVLEIGRNREARSSIYRSDVIEYVFERGTAVEAPERKREAGTRTRERFEPECLEDPGRAGIPGVRNKERLALVQRTKVCGLLILSGAHDYLLDQCETRSQVHEIGL